MKIQKYIIISAAVVAAGVIAFFIFQKRPVTGYSFTDIKINFSFTEQTQQQNGNEVTPICYSLYTVGEATVMNDEPRFDVTGGYSSVQIPIDGEQTIQTVYCDIIIMQAFNRQEIENDNFTKINGKKYYFSDMEKYKLFEKGEYVIYDVSGFVMEKPLIEYLKEMSAKDSARDYSYAARFYEPCMKKLKEIRFKTY